MESLNLTLFMSTVQFTLTLLLVSYCISSYGFQRVIAPAFSTPAFQRPRWCLLITGVRE